MANPDLPAVLCVLGIVYIVFGLLYGLIILRHPYLIG